MYMKYFKFFLLALLKDVISEVDRISQNLFIVRVCLYVSLM